LAKRQRRDRQHLGQQSVRRKSYRTGASAPGEIYRPGFPMNIFGNVKLFAIVGIVAATVLVAAAFLTTRGNNSPAAEPFPSPSPTATPDPNATPTPTPAPTQEAKQWTAPEQVIDAEAFDYAAEVETTKGTFTIALDAATAPNTVNSFVFLAQNDFFDGVAFHRIVSNFVIQGGDPTGTGRGGPGYLVQDEPNQVSNTRYTIAMAKSAGAGGFGSQFFINLKDNVTLDYTNPGDKFYPFGRVVEGQDVVDAIGAVGTPSGQPTEQVVILDVRIVQTPKAR
jgi:cyclophilin family peptidyl-prolyl cis-trans isomerase